MVTFIQLKSGKDELTKCLKAINQIASSADWLDNFNEEAKRLNHLPTTNLELPYWQGIKNIDIEWEYQNVYAQDASYEYENSNGIKIIIKEGRNRRSEVIEFIGLPEEYRSYFEGLDNIALSETIDRYIKNTINKDNIELRIAEYTL